ncbi:MAG TPA: hypothetical protein VNO35_01130 [Steroidobacteraceae bacterium]|nr:hypothetical protein [Steroidobacteraceae bacterium]
MKEIRVIDRVSKAHSHEFLSDLNAASGGDCHTLASIVCCARVLYVRYRETKSDAPGPRTDHSATPAMRRTAVVRDTRDRSTSHSGPTPVEADSDQFQQRPRNAET